MALLSINGGQTYDVNVADNSGMAMFSDLAPGTYNVFVRWGNNECAVDLGSVTLEDVRQATGTQCDDEDATTINDVILEDGCTCGGTPVGEITLVCANDLAEILQPGEDGAIVVFDEPTGSTTCGLDGLTIEQIEGLTSGSLFPIGTTTIKYRVTDACGNMEMCSFMVIIEETPLMFDLLCADDIEVTEAVGDNGVIVTFNEPSVISNCPDNQFTIIQTAGLISGSLFPVGLTTVTFMVSDECGQVDECSFNVTVNPAPTGEITFTCNDDITVTETVGEDDGVVVTFNDPTATTTCSLDGLNVTQIEGLASGSIFPVGMTVVTYIATDACGEEEICSFKITVNPAPTGEIFLTCAEGTTITIGGDVSTAIVEYNEPIAITSCELDGLNVTLVEGLPSGSAFPIGVNTVVYEATDACGEVERCSLTITVVQFIEPCLNDIVIENKVCNDNDTPTDPSDDTYTFDVIVMRTGGAATSYLGSYDNAFLGTAIYEADYDEVVTLGPFPAGSFTSSNTNPPVTIEGGLDINLRIVDADDPNCTDAVVVESPGPCSDELPKGSIGDLVFFDENQNGIQDTEDTGVSGVTVKLLNINDEVLRTVETDSLGAYKFEEVEAGDYKIMVNLVDDFRFALADQGDDEEKDSDITENGMTDVFTLVPGQDRGDIDAGLVKPIIVEKVKVGDIVFNDANGNGIRDNGEAGIKDVFIQLLQNGEMIEFTTSDDNGMYMFADLTPGDYQLKFMGQPADLIPTLQDEGDNDAKDSDIDSTGLTEVFTLVTGFDDTRDAGFKPRVVEPDPARIGNQVFVDVNENGEKEENEPGINGVQVKLLAENGDVVATTQTENNGIYGFSVAPGIYQVMFGTPSGFNPTNQSGNATDDIDNDSDNDPATGMTELFTVVPGEVNPTIDAGFVALPDPCDNVTDGGKIEADEDPEACGPYDAAEITNVELPSGGTGNLEYIWLASTIECPTELTDMIPGANGPEYDPGVLTETTYFVRCARRIGCEVWIESDCVVKKVDRCDNGGPVDCDAVAATVSEGKVTVTGLIGSNAKVEIIGAGTGWIPTLVCGDGGTACENPQMITDLPVGDYTIKVQLWGADGSYCYTERKVTVGGEPECETDGGRISTNDDTTDLCVGDNEPNIVNFAATGGNGTNSAWVVTDNSGVILNPNASSSIDFEGAGTGTCYVYYVRYENISGLEARANIEDLTGCFDKSNRIEVSKTENCGDPTCEVDGGTIATNDETTGLCVNDGEANIVNFTATGGNGTNSAWVVTDENGTILNPDAPSSIDFEGAGAGTCRVYYIRYENIEGLVEGANINDLTGCFDKSNNISIYRRDDCNNEKPQCEDVLITTGNGKINLVGLSAPFVVVKIHDINAGWAIIDQCVGCEDPTTFTVPAGDYNVVVEFYEGFWDTKYCRADVRVTVGDGDPCTDGDGDGVCFEEDCDDNNANIGARQSPGTTCDDGNDVTINDVIQADGCTCAGEEDTTPEKEICIERDVFNTDNCQFNLIYGLYLKLDGYDEYYEVSNAAFIEYTDGTALFTATAINNTAPNIGWDIEVEFGARTTLAEVAPKQHNCLAADVNDFYFYETLEGKLTGINDAAGASMTITRIGPAFQLGIAANITHNAFDFGGSGWFVADMLTQPTSGLPLILNEGAQGQNGDININLSGDGTECIEGRNNSELDCANVTAIATADGITISGLTAPIEIVKVFDANWVPVEDCTGDCGESMTVVADPGNYVVRVNFYTANWIGECEVDIPVTIPTSGNLNSGAFSRNADKATLPQINTMTDLAAIAVFPNPATEEVFVNLKSFTGQKANIQVVNTYGQIVKQFNLAKIPTKVVRLDISNFQNGLYYLSINIDDSNTFTKKVLVNRSN